MAMHWEHSLRVPDIKDEPPYVTTASAAGDDSWLQIVGIVADKRE
jgi:hypothetical protein